MVDTAQKIRDKSVPCASTLNLPIHLRAKSAEPIEFSGPGQLSYMDGLGGYQRFSRQLSKVYGQLKGDSVAH